MKFAWSKVAFRGVTAAVLPVSMFLAISAIPALGQDPVKIRIDAAKKTAPFKQIYSYFGYDEANYTYTKNGSKLVGELAAATKELVYIRTHFLLATGDGIAGLKSGSTNAYTEDAAGHPVYEWSTADRIFDTYLQANAKPFVEIGFMPKALSTNPEPYQTVWIPGAANKDYAAGWSYPPRDYGKWGELIYQWARHCAEKYGKQQAESWYWEVWNEPDIFYWHGTQEEYNKLYDYAVAAVKRALPNARVGGPASTGPSSEKAAAFLKAFLSHCTKGNNYATGGNGAPLNFVTFHAKGSPQVIDGHVRMGIARNLQDVDAGLKILSSFAKFRNLPVILSESDPEGCAACSARVYPQNAYRNGPLYASYTAAVMKGIFELSDRYQGNIAGMLTWAFEFEGQPYFDGFRTLATNGVDKPILNLFRMDGFLRGDRIEAVSSGAVSLGAMLAAGVRDEPDVDVIATRDEHGVSVMIWNYQDDDVAGPAARIEISMQGLPVVSRLMSMSHFRIDADHSNAYSVWKGFGSPQMPTPDQQRQLEAAGQLQQLVSSDRFSAKSGSTSIQFDLPRQAVSLIRIEW
jgi:xylan 1,4-beta-xylosidase